MLLGQGGARCGDIFSYRGRIEGIVPTFARSSAELLELQEGIRRSWWCGRFVAAGARDDAEQLLFGTTAEIAEGRAVRWASQRSSSWASLRSSWAGV